MESRIEGCFLGQLIGDALGTRYEFKMDEDAQEEINNDMVNGFLPIIGEGPFDVGKGQPTDDSELAMALARGIATNNKYDKELVAKNYITWFKSPPFDIGRTTRVAFHNANNYDDIVNNSQANIDSLSNGCLMRVSPLAIHGLILSDYELMKIIYDDCIMTNPNPIAIDATTVFVFAMREAIKTGSRQKSFNKALEVSNNQIIIDLLNSALMEPTPTYVDTYKKKFSADSRCQGYFGIAFQNAFYHLMHSNNYHDALLSVMRLGGDTDTNGCIVGSLLGALYGIDSMPKQWIESVKYPKFSHNRDIRYPLIKMDDYIDIINGLLS